jgi:hypothetical protein
LPKKTLNLIEETGNDALIQVKRNQPTLFDTLTGWAQAEPAAQTHRTVDIGRRNRIESRQATVWQLPHDITASLAEWPRMCCLVRIERSTDVLNPGQRHWKPRHETAWYICTRALTAEHANASAGKSRANSSGEAYWILLNRWSASPSAVILSQRPKAPAVVCCC